MKPDEFPFWTVPPAEALARLGSSLQGLVPGEAQARLEASRSLLLRKSSGAAPLKLLLAQFTSPIVLILLFAAALSAYLADPTDAAIILVIVMASGLLSFWQERGAAGAVAKLLAIVQSKALVRRAEAEFEVAAEAVVKGDIVRLAAGDLVPGDCLLLETHNLFVNEAALTGETFPVEKRVDSALPEACPLAKRVNTVFLGTNVTSGAALAVVARVGRETELGKVSDTLRHRAPETEFERGLRRFGWMLMEITLLLVLAIFAVNVYLARPVLDSFLFALALAVGLTPQLLPAIVSINLARGAGRMAAARVIVKRLAAIENFGSMDTLCSDKTGTLTEGEVKLHSTVGLDEKPSESLSLYAYLNAHHQAGYANPIDAAICTQCPPNAAGYRKLDEAPYDFVRKRLSVLLSAPDGPPVMIVKGALENVLSVCSTALSPSGEVVPLQDVQSLIQALFQKHSAEGFRTLGLATRFLPVDATRLTEGDEAELTFRGFLFFFDPIRPGVIETVRRLRGLGVKLKCITGDNALVAAKIGREAGLDPSRILTGNQLHEISAEALPRRAVEADLFAEVEPHQKERLIQALQKAGCVVGYLGDGINDAAALHAADVGISVANAVDVAREAADIVLLEKDLAVLENGVREGRLTFANTLKYIFMATSANFGNMFSMAGASLFLPFLPLLPKQILLTNLLTDLPEMTIAGDRVDPEMVEQPRRMDLPFVRRFMLVFGLISSVFDFVTFALLLKVLHATPEEFRSGWFVESVVSASSVVLVVRSRRPFFRSRPSSPLLAVTGAVVVFVVLLPYIPPLARLLGFAPLPPLFLLMLAVVVLFYVLAAELAKAAFYRSPRHS